MAQATFVKAAQKDIYKQGKRVEYVSEKGKRKGQTLSKIDRTIPADDKDEIYIAKGEPYYWWQFLHGGKNLSKTAPRRSQLTQSGFLSSLYELEDSLSELKCETKEDFEVEKENIMSEIENMKDECQNSLDNMPESLQSSPTGELLQERIDALDSWYSEVEGIECEEYDEEEISNELKEQDEKTDDETDEEYEERIEHDVQEKISEFVMDAISQLQETSCGL